ncbi:hypothetical protein [Pleionea litopenaei]|uniref:Uncharacterized protein n=1 Tax=Pleionea litopenaei TaxID=3070815 RepID=A0AA51RSJ3_9GAMM|nr:hypothetical protein [Pleionea sp. HL-JVS1]WMS86883.1 hypothetical protein Q9312_16835 [Pleionea sp. HL-JVS1]
MLMSYFWFQILVYGAVGLAALAPIILIALVIIDWHKEQLW